MGTFTMCPAWTHWAHCDQIDGHFVKELNMCTLADGWAHCLKNHNVITMYPLGKWPFAPSVCSRSINALLNTIDRALEQIECTTGIKVVMLIGGPVPAENGEFNIHV